jgi:hypothetical protein
MSDIDDDFFEACDIDEPLPEAQRSFGLVVGPVAMQTFNAKHEIEIDELPLIERAILMGSRGNFTTRFIEEDDA